MAIYESKNAVIENLKEIDSLLTVTHNQISPNL